MPDNLPELRDIHLPDGVSAFPPAYGWWVILATIIALVALVYMISVIRRKSKKLYALHLLQNIYCNNTIASAVEMSGLLRRICIFKYKEAITLSGINWIKFLNSKTKKPLADKTAELLLNAPYIPQNSKGFAQSDVIALRQFCKNWIGENL